MPDQRARCGDTSGLRSSRKLWKIGGKERGKENNPAVQKNVKAGCFDHSSPGRNSINLKKSIKRGFFLLVLLSVSPVGESLYFLLGGWGTAEQPPIF